MRRGGAFQAEDTAYAKVLCQEGTRKELSTVSQRTEKKAEWQQHKERERED